MTEQIQGARWGNFRDRHSGASMVAGRKMTSPLREQMNVPDKRDVVVDDAVRLLEDEVKGAKGMSGLAIKGAFKVLSSARPGFVRHVVDRLLDDFMDALDPFYQSAVAAGRRPGADVEARPEEVSEALLKVADARVARSSNQGAKKTYGKLRPSAHKQVAAAAAPLGHLLDRHAAAS